MRSTSSSLRPRDQQPLMIEDARRGEDDGMQVDLVGMDESDDVVGNESRGSGDADEEAEEEAERQRPLRDPGQPTQEMIDEHNLSHIPFRPWCAACIRGKAKDDPSRKLKGVWAESLVPRVRLDYAFLTECEGPTCVPCQPGEPGAYDDVHEPSSDDVAEPDAPKVEDSARRSGSSLTVLVMQESMCSSVWAYAVESKGATEEWAVHQICEDLETVGLKNDRIIVKSDQEVSIIDMSKQIATSRASEFGTGIDNSKVGDSRQ